MPHEPIGYPCPSCNSKTIESVARLPYVRGYILLAERGRKTLVGCRSCVRKGLLRETGRSALLGWFSPTALVTNPFFLVYGLMRAGFVRTNPKAVRKVLADAGLAEDGAEVDLLKATYCLAASVIAADGKVLREEIVFASQMGAQMFEGFDPEAFRQTVANHDNLPEPTELARLLGAALAEEHRVLVYRYLLAVAHADNALSEQEQALISAIGTAFGFAADGARAAA